VKQSERWIASDSGVFGQSEAILKVNSIVRDEITTEFARKISDLIARLNEIRLTSKTPPGKRCW
jgi:ABC-type phosphate/phosphonate transport system substrate-binding protein